MHYTFRLGLLGAASTLNQISFTECSSLIISPDDRSPTRGWKNNILMVADKNRIQHNTLEAPEMLS